MDGIALFIAILTKVVVLAIFAVVSYIDDGLHITVVALIVGKHITWLTNLFSKIFLRGIGKSLALYGFGYEITRRSNDLWLAVL